MDRSEMFDNDKNGMSPTKWVMVGLWLVVCVVVGIAYYLQSPQEAQAVNVVQDITPRHTVSHEQGLILASLKGKSPQEIKAILDEEWPTISTDLITWLRSSNRIKTAEKIDKIGYFWGSGEAAGEDVNEVLHEGVFKEKLLAEVVIAGREKPMLVAVKCTNGLFRVKGQLTFLYDDEVSFVVERRKSLVDYVSYETAIFLAETFSLPVYRGKGRHRRRVTPAEVRGIDTEKVFVSVLVFPGDEFNLQDMTYNGKSPKGNFLKNNQGAAQHRVCSPTIKHFKVFGIFIVEN